MSNFIRISVQDADRILATKPDALLLDSRQLKDFSEGHHPKAQHLTDPLLRKIIKQKNKATPIIVYCYHGHMSQDFAQLFAEFGFQECYSVDGGYASWRHQVEENFPVTVKARNWMKNKGFNDKDINARVDNQNRTALMIAARNGCVDILQDLVEAGANPNLTDIRGNNALWYACIGQSIESVRELINADVEVDNQNNYGFTALNYSVGMDDIFDILANYFCDDSLLRLGKYKTKVAANQTPLQAIAS